MNRLPEIRFFHVRLRTSVDTTATINDVAIINKSTETDDLSKPGICVAKAQLYKTLDPQPLHLTEATIDERGVICPIMVPPSSSTTKYSGCYAVVEFTIKSPVDCDLNVRTACSTDPTEAGNWDDVPWGYNPNDPDHPVPPDPGTDKVHVRGWWPYSRIRVAARLEPAVNLGLAGNQYVMLNIVDMNGVEFRDGVANNFSWLGKVIDKYGRSNVGLYGADAEYRMNVVNTSATARTLRPWLVARGGKYWGRAASSNPRTFPASLREFPF